MQLSSKSRGVRGIEPETFKRRSQLLSCHPTTGPNNAQVPSFFHFQLEFVQTAALRDFFP